MSANRADIVKWMMSNARRFQDECGELNCTLMVETWDIECASGGDTLDYNHPAWECAMVVADKLAYCR